MKNPVPVATVAAMLVFACSTPAFSQHDSTPRPPVLAGPSVPERASRKTLVEYDFPGKVRRLDAAPEEGALRLMDLDMELREKVERVLTERMKQLDEFVGKNLDLLTKLETASATGDRIDQAMLLAEGVHKLSPVWLRGSLRSQIDELLSKDKQAEMKALLDEYWDAIVKERQAPAAGPGGAANDRMIAGDTMVTMPATKKRNNAERSK
ncbi:MAG: hypothetical protein H7210_01810, partial [Pyrinomonadaceae bacterium]|nr:hypothetical protein [Phycisphaerales bacterium]